MALFSNQLSIIRQYLSSAVGDLDYGQCGTAGASTCKIYAPFLHKADEYYSDHNYEVYVYEGTNIGVASRVKDWANSASEQLLEIYDTLDAACNTSSYIEMHYIFTEDEYRKAINLGIESLAGKYLVDIKDESTVLIASTCEYALPTSMLYLERVTTEKTADGGIFEADGEIDPRDYRIIKSYPPKLKLHEDRYSITAGKDLRLEGQGTQPIVDDDTDIIYLPPDWLVQKAITFLPQNKIQSNKLDEVYRRALIISAREPRNWPAPRSQRIVE